MNVYLKVLLTALLLTPVAGLFSQKPERESKLEGRVKLLEEYKANIQLAYQNSVSELKTGIKDEVEAKKKEIDETTRLLKIIAFGGIPSTILGLIGVYWAATKKANKLITDRIENIVETKRDAIIRLIETQEFDTRLRNTKKIIVLSSSEDSQDKAKPLFLKFNFKTIHFRVVQAYQNFTEYDLIVFNNGDGSFNKDLLKEFLHNTTDEDASFVAYTNERLDPDPRLNFSNTAYTLYHGILSSLKYSVILKSGQENVDSLPI